MSDEPEAARKLAHRNLVHLMVVEALLGQIAPEVHAIAVDFQGGDELTLHFALTYEYEGLAADLDEILDELEARFASVPLVPMIQVQVVKHVGDTGTTWPGYDHYRVYMAKTAFGEQ
jgi:hypothetical protein